MTGDVIDGGVSVIRSNEGECVAVAVDGVTAIHRATESVPAPTITVTRSRRAHELRELENLRAGYRRLEHDNDELRQRVCDLERQLADRDA